MRTLDEAQGALAACKAFGSTPKPSNKDGRGWHRRFEALRQMPCPCPGNCSLCTTPDTILWIWPELNKEKKS